MSNADVGVGELNDALNFVRVRAAAALIDVHPIRLVVRNGRVRPELA